MSTDDTLLTSNNHAPLLIDHQYLQLLAVGAAGIRFNPNLYSPESKNIQNCRNTSIEDIGPC